MYDNAGAVDEKARFNERVTEWREKRRAGQVTEEEFVTWLKSNYKTKYKG